MWSNRRSQITKSRSFFRKGRIRQLFTSYIILLGIIILNNPILLVKAQVYDPNTFNYETLTFSSLGGITPSNKLDETLFGFSEKRLFFNLTFNLQESLYQLENDLEIEYGLALTINSIRISPNTSVTISNPIWNNNNLDWNFNRSSQMDNQSASTYTISTILKRKIATQTQNLIEIFIMIETYNISVSDVKLTIDEDKSNIIINRVRSLTDLPSSLLTLAFSGIFVFSIVVFPIWLYGSFEYGWKSPLPYIRKLQYQANNFLKKLTFHKGKKIKKCPSCKNQIIHKSNYCPNCGLDFDLGIIGIFRIVPFNFVNKVFPYVLGFILLPFVIFLPNMSFPIITGLMLFAIFMAGQTFAIAKPTFNEVRAEILVWEKKGGIIKRLFTLILLILSVIFYIQVFIPTFIISFIIFLITVYGITRLSSTIETSETKLLLQKYQKELGKYDHYVEDWEKGGKIKKGYLAVLGRSKGRMTKKAEKKTQQVEKKTEQIELLEKDFLETQKQSFDWKRTYVYVNYGVSWFSGSLLAFTLGNTYRIFAPAFGLPMFGLPLSRLGFINEVPFFTLHVLLFLGIMLYCFIKDPLKPDLTFVPFQKLKFDTKEGKISNKVKFYCSVCNTELGEEKTRSFFKLRKSKETLVDHAEKYLTPCEECGKWIGEECLLAGGCLECHPYCSSCGEKLQGNNQSECKRCGKKIKIDEAPTYCEVCGRKINQTENYCNNCGKKFDWKNYQPTKYIPYQEGYNIV